MADHANELSCIAEGAGFMSPQEMVRTTVHPYKKAIRKHMGISFLQMLPILHIAFLHALCMAYAG